MKKILYIVPLALLITLVSCGSPVVESANQEVATEIIDGTELSLEDIRNAMNENQAPEEESEDPDDLEAKIAQSIAEGIDVDLTVLSSTMVYSQVYDMLSYPESYIGDIVKMEGQFSYNIDPATNKAYYACIIADAAACCQSGFEFTWEAFENPDNLPKDLANIEVIGSLRTYEENGFEYVTLDATSVVVK